MSFKMLVIIGIIIYFFVFFRVTAGLFVKVGNHSKTDMDVNLLECGHRFVATVISFEKKCFVKHYPNRTVFADRQEPALNRIFHGRNALIGDSPWTVRIDIRNKICTGVLVTFDWVLTAAHCIGFMRESDASDMAVLPPVMVHVNYNQKVGHHSIEVNLRKTFRHPIYVQNQHAIEVGQSGYLVKKAHDIGLIKLVNKFPRQLNDGIVYLINTVCLPNNSYELNSNVEKVTFTGYGAINEWGTSPRLLQIGEGHLLPTELCNKTLKRPDELCAFHKNLEAKSCKGDSGGPLVQYEESGSFRAILIGINEAIKGVRAGPIPQNRCLTVDQYGLWVPVMRFIPWLLDIMEHN